MQQQFETEQQREHPGYTTEEYQEVVRRAQRIRADKENRLSHEDLAESAAEVGIREEDLREAERQLREERAQRAQRQRTQRIAAAVTAAILALFLVFSYNSLNGQRLGAVQARANLQTVLQRRADLLPQLERAAERGTAAEQQAVEQLAGVREGLQSRDVATQLRANQELNSLVSRFGDNPELQTSELYRGLMDEIAGSENRIAVARQDYNAAATRYNNAAQSFPTNLVRPLLGFPGEMPYFQPGGG